MKLIDSLPSIVAFVTVFISFFLGRQQALSNQKTEVARERYNNFYVPFLRYLYLGHMDVVEFSNLAPDTRDELFALVFNNVHYLGDDTRSQLFNFFDAYFAVKEKDKGNVDPKTSIKDADRIFRNFLQAAIPEARKLEVRLKYPKLGKEF